MGYKLDMVKYKDYFGHYNNYPNHKINSEFNKDNTNKNIIKSILVQQKLYMPF